MVGAVGVMGISYGAGTAIEWAAADRRIKAVVAVAPFASLRLAAPGYAVFPFSRTFVDGAIDRAAREGAFDAAEASPAVAMARTRVPVLLVHGEEDERVPAWHSKLLLAAGRDHAELLVIPGAGHLSIVASKLLAQRAPAWFAAHLPPPSASQPAKDDDEKP